MHHGLLIAAQVVTEARVLLEGLSEPANITVTEYPETSFDKSMFPPVTFGVLRLQKGHNGLSDREASDHEEILPGSGAMNR
jgi:hypothetical protein